MSAPCLYEALKAAGCELDNHESDLYVRVTPESAAILAQHPDHSRGTFVSQIDVPVRVRSVVGA